MDSCLRFSTYENSHINVLNGIFYFLLTRKKCATCACGNKRQNNRRKTKRNYEGLIFNHKKT